MYQTKIAELERALEEAKAQLAKEDGERFRVVWRDISGEEKSRILDGLTDRKERVLFGLDVPEERKRGAESRPGGSGGDLTCEICGKSGLTRRGLALHTVRMHKEEEEAGQARPARRRDRNPAPNPARNPAFSGGRAESRPNHGTQVSIREHAVDP